MSIGWVAPKHQYSVTHYEHVPTGAAKKAPGKLNFGHAGVGSSSHLIAAPFAEQAGIDVVLVPYAYGTCVSADGTCASARARTA